jgi:hypothetical protein
VLEKNPNYHGPRPARLQRITYDVNTLGSHAVAQITAGQADYTADVLSDSQFKRLGPLDQKYGLGHGGTGKPAMRYAPVVGESFIQFNTLTGRSEACDFGRRSILRSTACPWPGWTATFREPSTFRPPSRAVAASPSFPSSPILRGRERSSRASTAP